ncbi:SIR2 family NAD-dependent protein deacylase [Flammeovirga kamogawensis]|uniref:NAD-dependent protein deacylase n=1 Tax=Flammeovirga kamogawensis TaxID=373891 RepID=A0ABX8GWW4_9BACT|nr:NAD-dependent deacylase [Flammeovirga kamogawensis]MBB6461258.1 NAD-dependent deacetylase [Flammeovirga kamogawensis]QWG07817.1 NAD-dependent deacylase [Flammeovirga kamogawensis]TRX69622.1 NAD-dependent deacylase [Flammeovirga kamogawensis]
MQKQKIIVLTGAGISAESGIPTFRGGDGLWEGHDIMDVASPIGWKKDRNLVLNFYNERRKVANNAKPNKGHIILAELENYYDVTIITQNVDSLHEKAGSTNVIHLHGKLSESRSSLDESLIYPIVGDILAEGEKCEKGSQLRPNIVWFGEDVPLMQEAAEITSEADFFIIVGTSLQVYPAANLIDYVPKGCESIIIDPSIPTNSNISGIKTIQEKGSVGLPILMDYLMKLG